MSIFLGNLSVDQIEKRIGIEFPEATRKFMETNHQCNAGPVAKGKWHCFDIPFHIVCGDIETAKVIYGSVKDQSSKVVEPLAFSITKQEE